MGHVPVPFFEVSNMITFREIIARVDDLVPNAYTQEQKLRWLTMLDSKLAANVFCLDIAEIRAMPFRHPEGMDAEPLVDEPHAELYDYWLTAQIHLADQEYTRYQNIMELFNACYSDFKLWFCNTYQPAKWGRSEEEAE